MGTKRIHLSIWLAALTILLFQVAVLVAPGCAEEQPWQNRGFYSRQECVRYLDTDERWREAGLEFDYVEQGKNLRRWCGKP